MKAAAKGRLNRPPAKASATTSAAQLRLNRRNQAKQVQVQKRHALINATRLFSGVDGAPRIVAIVPLSSDVDAHQVARALSDAVDGGESDFTFGEVQKLRHAKQLLSMYTKY